MQCGSPWMVASCSPHALQPCCSRRACSGGGWGRRIASLRTSLCLHRCASCTVLPQNNGPCVELVPTDRYLASLAGQLAPMHACDLPHAPACSCLGGSVELEASVHLLGPDLQHEARAIFPDAPAEGQASPAPAACACSTIQAAALCLSPQPSCSAASACLSCVADPASASAADPAIQPALPHLSAPTSWLTTCRPNLQRRPRWPPLLSSARPAAARLPDVPVCGRRAQPGARQERSHPGAGGFGDGPHAGLLSSLAGGGGVSSPRTAPLAVPLRRLLWCDRRASRCTFGRLPAPQASAALRRLRGSCLAPAARPSVRGLRPPPWPRAELRAAGHWCDCIDPRTGLALHGSQGARWSEVAGAPNAARASWRDCSPARQRLCFRRPAARVFAHACTHMPPLKPA